MKIPILMYHQIDQTPARGTPLRGLVVHPRSFGWQMLMLRAMGYRGLSMRDLEPYLCGDKKGRVVGITFDDGYRNNVQHALPVLHKHGFTATCYGVSQLIGGSNVWDHALGIPHKPLMDLADWKAWLNGGMDLGSHTCTHADLLKLDIKEARQEINDSKAFFEAALGYEVRHFCYPYGRFNASHKALVQDAGYHTATTTRRGRVHTGFDPFAVNRIMVARSCTPWQFVAKIMSAYEDKRA